MKKQDEQTYNLKLTKNQLGVIARALEAFERAQLGQFKMSLEQIFEFEVDEEYRKNLKQPNWDEYQALEQIIKTTIFTRESDVQRPHTYFGITQASESAKISYEIQKVIQQFLFVENNDGFWDDYRTCDDPLTISKEPIPEVVDFKKYKDFPIPEKEWKKLREKWGEGDISAMWEITKKYIPENVEGDRLEIYPFSNKLAPKDMAGNLMDDICIRIWKPKKKENENKPTGY